MVGLPEILCHGPPMAVTFAPHEVSALGATDAEHIIPYWQNKNNWNIGGKNQQTNISHSFGMGEVGVDWEWAAEAEYVGRGLRLRVLDRLLQQLTA